MSPMPQARSDAELLVVGEVPLARPPRSLDALSEIRCCRTTDSLTTVTLPFPQMQMNGNTRVTSPSANRRRAEIGVYRTSVRVSVPYLPLEKLGAEPNCHCVSCAVQTSGLASSMKIAATMIAAEARSCIAERSPIFRHTPDTDPLREDLLRHEALPAQRPCTRDRVLLVGGFGCAWPLAGLLSL